MAETSFFDRVATHTTHVPDVLSCIANLSNDEVFTPPDVVNKMLDLLPQELFADPKTTFLDPATKTGVFLREIAKRCLDAQLPGYKERSLEISEKNRLNIPLDEYDKAFQKQLQGKIDHIFHNQLFGIGITELTSLLARRSLYCSKYPNGPYSITKFDDAEGNIRFRRTEHVWGRDGKCVFCGANQKQYDRGGVLESHAYEFIHTVKPEEIFKMQFDVIIGNPPYQISTGGGQAQATPLYDKFVQQSKKLNPKYICMIIPSRWFSGGMGLNAFRKEMMNDTRLSYLADFVNAKDCFPGVSIGGGVNYFLWEKSYDGPCEIVNMNGKDSVSGKRYLNEYPIVIRNNRAVNIVHKVLIDKTMEDLVSAISPFGLPTYVRGEKKPQKNYVKVYSSGGVGYIDRSEIKTGDSYFDKFKVLLSANTSEHAGEPSKDGTFKVFASIKPLKPTDVCTHSYVTVGMFNDEQEMLNCMSYLQTKFVRFLILQTITGISISKEKFRFVPIQDFSKPWTDEELYAKYNLTDEEITFIESMIKPMDLGGDE